MHKFKALAHRLMLNNSMQQSTKGTAGGVATVDLERAPANGLVGAERHQ